MTCIDKLPFLVQLLVNVHRRHNSLLPTPDQNHYNVTATTSLYHQL